MTQVLAVIPARAGSKGIPRKNLRKVGNRTLIGHACHIASKCPSVDAVVITSDDSEMGEEGVNWGAGYFIRRPDHLATDDASAADTWAHAWTEAEGRIGRQFDVSVLLQPTSPGRAVQDVEVTIRSLLDGNAHTAITVSPVPGKFTPYKQLRISDDGHLIPVIQGGPPNTQRQDLPTTYWLNGICYAATRASFLAERTIITNDAIPVVIDRPIANIDIPPDLDRARELFESHTLPTQL